MNKTQVFRMTQVMQALLDAGPVNMAAPDLEKDGLTLDELASRTDIPRRRLAQDLATAEALGMVHSLRRPLSPDVARGSGPKAYAVRESVLAYRCTTAHRGLCTDWRDCMNRHSHGMCSGGMYPEDALDRIDVLGEQWVVIGKVRDHADQRLSTQNLDAPRYVEPGERLAVFAHDGGEPWTTTVIQSLPRSGTIVVQDLIPGHRANGLVARPARQPVTVSGHQLFTEEQQ